MDPRADGSVALNSMAEQTAYTHVPADKALRQCMHTPPQGRPEWFVLLSPFSRDFQPSCCNSGSVGLKWAELSTVF